MQLHGHISCCGINSKKQGVQSRSCWLDRLPNQPGHYHKPRSAAGFLNTAPSRRLESELAAPRSRQRVTQKEDAALSWANLVTRGKNKGI